MLILTLCVYSTSDIVLASAPQEYPVSDSIPVKPKKNKIKPVRDKDKIEWSNVQQSKTQDTLVAKKKRVQNPNAGGFTPINYTEHSDTIIKNSKGRKQKTKHDTLQHYYTKTSDSLVQNKRVKQKVKQDSVQQTDSEITDTLTQYTKTSKKSKKQKKVESDTLAETIQFKSDVEEKHRKLKNPFKTIGEKQEIKEVQNDQNVSPQNKYQEPVPVTYTREQVAAMLLDTGNYYLENGRFARAKLYFDSLTNYYQNTFPYKFGFYFNARCKMGLQDVAGAVNDFNYFLQLDECKSNFCTDTHYNLGVLKFKLGQIDQAMQEFDLAAKDSSYKNYKFIFFYRGFCYAQQENYIKAIQDLTKFLNYNSVHTYSTAEAIYYRGYYKTQLQDYRGAIKDYDAAIEMYLPTATGKNANPQHVQKIIEVYIVRGLAKSQIKKYDDAIADYNLVIKLNPMYATAYRLKGLDEIKKGDLDQGCLDLSRAGELGSTEAYNDIKQFCK